MKHIRASVIDGRAASPNFRRRQVYELYTALLNAQKSITAAVEKDIGCTTSEAGIIFATTLRAIATIYSQLDPQEALQRERRLAEGHDNHQQIPVGCLYLIPNLGVAAFYSTVVPIAAAIGAGNCVVVDIPQTISSLSGVLREVLKGALDVETFAVVDKNPFDADFAQQHVVALDLQAATSKSSRLTWSGPNQLCLTYVDATADLDAAAASITHAATSFASRSRYAPGVILINEFQLDELAKRLVDAVSKTTKAAAVRQSSRRDLKDTKILYSDGMIIAVAQDERSHLLRRKSTEPLILLHPVSSSDRAIDLMNELRDGNQLAALYLYGTPAISGYVSQFVAADLTFVNHIPMELMTTPFGPPSESLHPRWNASMFSYSTSQYAQITSSKPLEDAAGDLLRIDALPVLEEKPGGSINFFEQGILTGLGITLLTISSSAVLMGVLASSHVYPVVIEYLKRW